MHASVRLLLAGTLAAVLAGCAPGGANPPLPATLTLLPFQTAGPSATAGTPSQPVEPLPTAGPSPTPRAYLVRANDTFLGIALAFGLTREELAAANPGLNADLLSIGQQILIPAPGADGSTATPIPTPTPLPLDTGRPRCFLTTSGGAWCLLTVRNNTEESVEGLTGWITLLDERGAPVLTLPVYPPLNVLPPGEAMVLAGFQPGPMPAFFALASALTMAVPVHDAAQRYPALEWSLVRSQPAADRRSWQAEIEVALPAEVVGTPRVTLALLALDAQGEVIGFTQWERQPALLPGERAVARLSVYSLGPAIERVEILAEALSSG
jgi:LysM repeat protein